MKLPWFNKKPTKPIVLKTDIERTTPNPWDNILKMIGATNTDEIPVISACVDAIASPIAGAEITGQQPYLRLIQDRWAVICRHLTRDYFLSGVGYVGIYPPIPNVNSEIVLIPSSANATNNDYLQFNSINLPWDNVAYVENPGPLWTTRGLSPLLPCSKSIEAWNKLMAWRDRLLARLPAMAAYASSPNKLSSNEVKDMGKALDNILGCSGGYTVVLTNGTTLSLPTMDDYALQNVLNQIEVEICSVMRVPPCIAGIQAGLDASTYSNYQTAEKVHYAQAVIPMAKRIERAFQPIDASFTINIIAPEDTATAGPDTTSEVANQ
jgi:hypothetical protein